MKLTHILLATTFAAATTTTFAATHEHAQAEEKVIVSTQERYCGVSAMYKNIGPVTFEIVTEE